VIRVVTVEGVARERGLQHGEQLREDIRRGVGRWLEVVATLGRPVEDLLAEFLGAVDFAPALARWAPEFLAEIDGIATAAELPRSTMLAYNLGDEMWLWALTAGYGDMVTSEPAARCTAVAARPPSTGRPLLAQTLDLPVSYCDTEVVLHVRSDEHPDLFTLTPAGVLGVIGCNEAGVGVCGNTLMPLNHTRSGVPVIPVYRAILQQESAAKAADLVRRIPHASGQNYLICDSDEMIDLECSASKVVEHAAGATLLAHTNHPLSNDDVDEAFMEMDGPESTRRQEFMDAHLPEIADAEDVKRLLSDRSVPICKVGEGLADSTTWVSMIVELGRPPRMWATAGPPSRNPFEEVDLPAA
jgi:isopenicillin-N N-acyltransferase-like protein